MGRRNDDGETRAEDERLWKVSFAAGGLELKQHWHPTRELLHQR